METKNKMIGETNHLTSVKLGCCILCSYYRYHRSSGTERSRESKKYLPPYNFPHRRMMQIKPVRLKIYAFLETLRNVSLMLKTRRIGYIQCIFIQTIFSHLIKIDNMRKRVFEKKKSEAIVDALISEYNLL
ncbi:uncharacterized protein LOC100865111 isoform X2 [Apis florea]|uniref:uncharacterized protein LOC100865111 isoform X2 n=1 Tax=Apis florea TaxID=7463 RepID=UPI0012FF5447|nr:uncharacterized protein LOC100865111 isoform X2 [Apis florea]